MKFKGIYLVLIDLFSITSFGTGLKVTDGFFLHVIYTTKKKTNYKRKTKTQHNTISQHKDSSPEIAEQGSAFYKVQILIYGTSLSKAFETILKLIYVPLF